MTRKFSFKKLSVFFLLLMVLLTAGGYIRLRTYDYSKLKPGIIHAVEEALERRLVIGGQVKFEFGTRPRIILENVMLKNASWGSRKDMAKIEHIELKTHLLPLGISGAS